MESLWRSTCSIPAYPKLHKDLTVEIVVVGGGLSGLLTAFFLQRAGKEVLLLEANRICGGTTEGTTAKITAQHGLIYNEIIKHRGEKAAKQYANAQQRAIGSYDGLVKSLKIDCAFSRLSAYLYTLSPSNALRKECKAAERLGLPASLTTKNPLPFPIAQALQFEEQAQFHPLRFAAAIAKHLQIREHTRVTQIAEDHVLTENGKINAKKIIVCTHYPIKNTPGFYFARMHQSRGYVLALESAADVNGMWLDAAQGGFSFRNAESCLLLGGMSHLTGKHPQFLCFQALKKKAKAFYPEARTIACWSAQDCMTADGVPFIGSYARSLPNVYVATGFNKWGITGAMVAAELLADLAQEKNDYPYKNVFSPKRWTGIQIRFKAMGAPRCTHMGCVLEWNPDTRTYDCPCHGSRFAKDGLVLSSPAVRDGKWKV